MSILETIADMQRASDLVDEANGTSDYNARLVELALIAREFLRRHSSAGEPQAEASEPECPAEVESEIWELALALVDALSFPHTSRQKALIVSGFLRGFSEQFAGQPLPPVEPEAKKIYEAPSRHDWLLKG